MTNLIVWNRFDIPFWEYAKIMAPPAVAAIVVNLVLFLWIFLRDIPARFSSDALTHAALVESAVGVHVKEIEGVKAGATDEPPERYATLGNGCCSNRGNAALQQTVKSA